MSLRLTFTAPIHFWRVLPRTNGWVALACLHIAILLAGVESAYVQSVTTGSTLSWSLLSDSSFALLLCLDMLVPLTIALLSRRFFMVYLIGQSLLSSVLLHYTIFFYNPLTLSTIYHSMQGAASLGADIFGFAKWGIIVSVATLCILKLVLVQLSRAPDSAMPRFWHLRGVTAIGCMAVICWISLTIYGKTGLSLLWIDSRGHTTATERRLEKGTREAVRNIGYVATWIGEWMSGTYTDTTLIYAEMRCDDPDAAYKKSFQNCAASSLPSGWDGLPVPKLGESLVMIQVESLDFAALSMKVNGHTVLPFIDFLAQDSLVLKVFAPHKVGSSNSDYEILNGRVADQNVIYYSYITDYPDSIISSLAQQGFQPAFFHGLEGSLFNLRDAYTRQGFSTLTFKDELTKAGYAPSQYIMGHIPDADLFNYALEQMPTSGRRSQFIITMSSHIPFLDPLPIFTQAGGTFARYVSSLRYLDQSLAAYYAQLPPGTVLVIWGDHGSDVEYPTAFPANKRHVPFIVHVKGDTLWLDQTPEKSALCPQTADAEQVDDPLRHLLEPIGRQDTPKLGTSRVYTLCEMAYYLRALVNQTQP